MGFTLLIDTSLLSGGPAHDKPSPVAHAVSKTVSVCLRTGI